MSSRLTKLAVSALVALSSLTGALALAGPAGATTPAPQADVVSPTASWPLGNCLAGCQQGTTAGRLALINYARSLEGIGPIYLPSDWSSLPADAQTLFIVNEERIGRGLPPFDGTTAYQNSLALSNAIPNPTLPNGGGSAWYPTASALTADYEWMYNGTQTCSGSSPTSPGCWEYRDAILASYPTPTSGANAGTVTMGAGYDGTTTYDNGMSAVFSAGGSNPNQPYATSWASILPTIPTSATPVPTSASTMLGGPGGETLDLFGSYLGGATAVHFGSVAVTPTTINTSEIQVTVPTQTGWSATPIAVTTPGGTSTPDPSWLTWTYPAAGSVDLPAPQANVADPTANWLVGPGGVVYASGGSHALAFINYARSLEGIGPIYLPSDWSSLPIDAQLLFLTNEERAARGLPVFTGTTAYQNSLAAQGASTNSDPPLPYGGGGAYGSGGRLGSYAAWMYVDGYANPPVNGACTTPGEAGCWGHRTNILTQYQPQSGIMTMGGASASSTTGAGTDVTFAAGGPNPNLPYATSWASILATIPTTPPVPVPTSANLTPATPNVTTFSGTGGQTLSLFGAYLGSATSVHFGSVAVTTISHLNPSEIQVTVPAQPGGTVASVTVTDAAGTSATSDLPAFTYLYPQPTITDMTPAYTTNPSVATTVTLTGTGFSVVGTETLTTCGASGATVSVPFVVNSDTSITAQVPAYPQPAASAVGCYLVLTTPSGDTSYPTNTTYSPDFLWLGALGFSSMSPSSGPANQSQSVTVHGSFTSGATFTVGGNPVTPTNVTDSGMTATLTVPPNPAGDVTGTVMVDVTFDGATAGESFSWTGPSTPSAPVITSVSPTSGSATQSQTVTLIGSGFSGATITSSGAAVRIVSESATSMAVDVPQNPSGNVNGSVTVDVANAGGSTPFTYDWVAYSPPPPTCPSGDTGTYPNCISPHPTYPNPPLSSVSSTPVVDMTSTPDGGGYWLANAAGDVSAHGDAVNYGGLGSLTLNAPIAHIVSTPDGKGYWLVAADGGTFAFGDAGFYGSMGGQRLNAPVVDIAPTPTGKGYWLVASDGGVFAFGDATFKGSMGGVPLNKPVIGITAAGSGYRMVASDGGIFSFGAPFYGSMGGIPLNRPIVGMADTANGAGYWMVASDGGIFAFGNAGFHGSMGGQPLNQPIVAMAGDPATGGYWEVAADGGIFSFGAPFYGAD